MLSKSIFALAFWVLGVNAQQAGNSPCPKGGCPSISVGTCTKAGCTSESKQVSLDSNWMWVHKSSATTNCYTGNEWDTSICPDATTCAANCAVEPSDYSATYGITASGSALKMNFVTHGQYSVNVGSRVYLMDSASSYKMFKLLNKEFTFDVDVSNLPCGLNGALYFVEMAADGGMSQYPGNKAGAAFGTGYCDAQCPHDIKFINGEANLNQWNTTGKDTGSGQYGTCCPEMDIWEANSISHAYTAHPCSVKGQTRCEGKDCGDHANGGRYLGVCDPDGSDFNPYRLGVKTYYGPGSSFAVDTTKPFTVVTQFITSDGTDTGSLSEIRRLYVQDGNVIPLPSVTLGGKQYDSLTDEFNVAQKTAFTDTDSFSSHGGMKAMGESMARGMVLVMSLWDDHEVGMVWLDSNDPPTGDASTPGVARGTCSVDSGKPEDVETNHADAYVTYSNVKFGEIGSTYNGTPAPAPTPTPAPGPGPTPTPGPTPSGCPGGDLSSCIALCPSSPAVAYQACVQACVARCT